MNKGTQPKDITKLIFLLLFSLGLVANHANAQGPNAPEAASFEPVDATDMVNLITGDFSYVLPLLNVPSPEGGYPLALSYHAGIALDQEASWVGLGWSLNPGAINRSVNGNPDDWKNGLIREFAYGIGVETSNTVSIGYGVPGKWSVGVGVSWGSNQSLNGSVNASFGMFNGSIGTEGVSAGISTNDNTSSLNISVGFNGSIGTSVGYNGLDFGLGYDKNGFNGNLGYGVSGGYASMSIGIGFSSSGIGLYNNSKGTGYSSTTMTIGSADYKTYISQNQFMLTTPFGYFSYGKNKTVWVLSKSEYQYTQGSMYLYQEPSDSSHPYEMSAESFHKNKKVKLYDVFELNTNSNFEQSIEDYYINSNNSLFTNFDNFNVSGQGIAGSISPTIANDLDLKSFSLKVLDGGLYDNDDYISYGSGGNGSITKTVNFDFHAFSNSYLNVLSSTIGYSASGDFFNVFFNGQTPLPNIPSAYNYSSNNKLIYLNNSFSEAKHKVRSGRFVEYFTVNDINNGTAAAAGLLREVNNYGLNLESCGFENYNGSTPINATNTYKNDETFKNSIGAFKVTLEDGKTYHYSLPVYQLEQVRRLYGIVDNKSEAEAHMDRMQINPYATHWLLTAITGPDYIKNDISRNYPDEGDYGYWVRFDYGKWSDGYIWRSPDGQYSQDVDMFGKVKEYTWGRKQLYYLDKIKTRTHTALFIKKLRTDNKSVSMNYKNFGHYYMSNMPQMNVSAHPVLGLDKIILLKNIDANNINKNTGADLTPEIEYNYELYANYFFESYQFEGYYKDYNAQRKFKVNKNDEVLDVNDIVGLNIESKALKVIRFNHDYNLAKGSPNSVQGKLSLNSVVFSGKGGISLVPPIIFSYGSNYNYAINEKSDFGYYKNQPQAWSLNKITTPTGGSIDFDYEPDSFNKVAIRNGRVFTSKLKFSFITPPPLGGSNPLTSPEGITRIKIEVDNLDPSANGLILSEYFDSTKTFFIDMWYSAVYNHLDAGYDRSSIDIDYKQATIVELNTSQNYMIVDVYAKSPFFRDVFQSSAEPVSVLNAGNHYAGVENQNLPRHELAWTDQPGHRKYSMRHTIIANKIKQDNSSGIRVKQIIVNENGKQYKTNYNYKNPRTNQNSGVIPYYPESDYNVNQQVPYISLLPGPVVTYEYVTESNDEVSREYRFKVLEEFDNTTTNGLISFGDLLQIRCVESTPIDNSLNKINLKYITVKNNLSSLGRIEQMTILNSKNQIISQIKNNYSVNYDDLSLGQFKASYHSLKSINIGYGNIKHFYYGNVSSIVDIYSKLDITSTLQGGFTNTTYFDKYDFLTGQVIESHSVSSDGKSIRTKVVPAYTIPQYNPSGGYGIGSKVDNPTNKNMLTQTAADYSYILDGGVWKETGVGITTWSNVWDYRAIDGTSAIPLAANEKIWRKHKSYIWNGVKDGDGIFLGSKDANGVVQDFDKATDDHFNWAVPIGVGIPVLQPAQWKQTSVVTLYDHYSAPLEMKDINNNLASTKMGDNNTKVMATGNAGYSELFFTSGEYVDNTDTWLEPGVRLNNAPLRDNTKHHTGTYSIATTSSSSFGVAMKANPLRVGKYKLSVWVEKTDADKAVLTVNGIAKSFHTDPTPVIAGDWTLKTAYIDVTVGNCNIYLSSSNASTVHYDDLLLRPIASSITGYVYNEWDELSHIIGNNGLATKFEYDEAGRLVKTYSEVLDDPTNGVVTGGFKPVKTNGYHYKDQP